MLHPTYQEIQARLCKTEEDRLLAKNSRYSIIIGTAKRAREIINDKCKEEERLREEEKKSKRADKIVLVTGVKSRRIKSEKPLSQAIDELMNEKYHIVESDDNIYINEEGKEVVVKKKKEYVVPEITETNKDEYEDKIKEEIKKTRTTAKKAVKKPENTTKVKGTNTKRKYTKRKNK